MSLKKSENVMKKNIDSVIFNDLKSNHIEELTNICLDVFSSDDPLVKYLNISKEVLRKRIYEDIVEAVKHDISLVAIDEDGSIVGSYLSYNLSKYDELLKIIKEVNGDIRKYVDNVNKLYYGKIEIKILSLNQYIFDAHIKINLKKLNESDKIQLLDVIDNMYLFDQIRLYAEKNRLEEACMCDYYCIRKDFFNSGLGQLLAMNYINHLITNKQKTLIFGSFFNKKSIAVIKKLGPTILSKFKIEFVEDTEDRKNLEKSQIMDSFLLLGDVKKILEGNQKSKATSNSTSNINNSFKRNDLTKF